MSLQPVFLSTNVWFVFPNVGDSLLGFIEGIIVSAHTINFITGALKLQCRARIELCQDALGLNKRK